MTPTDASEERTGPPDDPRDNLRLKNRVEGQHARSSGIEQHPVGTAMGAAGGMAAGAVTGLAAGPLGSLFGAVAGALMGGLMAGGVSGAAGEVSSHAVDTPTVDPTDRELGTDPLQRVMDAGAAAWRERGAMQRWEEVEPLLEAEWDELQDQRPLPWYQARDALRQGWQRAAASADLGLPPGTGAQP